jgi:hypothetical protein
MYNYELEEATTTIFKKASDDLGPVISDQIKEEARGEICAIHWRRDK